MFCVISNAHFIITFLGEGNGWGSW